LKEATRRAWGALAGDGPWAFTAVMAIAVVLRLAVWLVMGGPVIRGDGPAYIEWAERLARGDLSGFQDYPLHQLYPMLLMPAYAAELPVGPYLLGLHMALSVGTVALLYDAARQFTSRRIASAVAAAAAAYPLLLLWSPFVLSETPFFFFLSLFLAALTRFLAPAGARRGVRSLMLLGVTGALLLFARPVSVAILAACAGPVAYVAMRRSFGVRAADRSVVVAAVLALAATIALFATDTPLRRTVLRYPTVAQSLWLSTRYSSSSVAEWAPIVEQNRTLADRFAGDPDALWDHKVGEAVEFIRTRPGTYVVLAGRRFASYWMPALFSDGWSTSHRLFDLSLAISLYVGAIASLYGRRDVVRWGLFAAALSFGVLTSFSQIDTDGRYRVPAELILLLLAMDGYARLLKIVRERWRRMATSRPAESVP